MHPRSPLLVSGSERIEEPADSFAELEGVDAHDAFKVTQSLACVNRVGTEDVLAVWFKNFGKGFRAVASAR